MKDASSVSQWITAVKTGDEAAATKIWERFFPKLTQLAHDRMSRAARQAHDKEDVALSAFNHFFSDARAGRFPKLIDRHDLWQILTVLTVRKIIDVRRADSATKRGGHRVRGKSEPDEARSKQMLDELPSLEPGPEFIVDLVDEARFVLDRLEPGLRQVAVLKMRGLTNAEIADNVNLTCRSVERKLERIRRQWQEKL